ncbi:MAG: hypothetical protein WBF42_03550 [Terracidiphilus sp.]
MKRTLFTLVAVIMTAHAVELAAQQPSQPSQLTERGSAVVDGRPLPYVIHRLPVDAFPLLPEKIVAALEERGCTIPQTYEAHQPENVVHGSFSAMGADDWAVLCSVKGEVSLLVFSDGSQPDASEHPTVLAAAKETQRLQQQREGNDLLGFNWGIDRATPGEVHEAQTGMERRPAAPDHDALADSVIEHRTVYRFYAKGHWTTLDMPN